MDEEIEPSQKFLFFNVVPSWMVSFITHVGLIIILALLVMPSTEERDVSLVASSSPAADLDSIDLNLDAMDFEMSDPLEQEMSEEIPVEMPMQVEEVSLPEATVDFGSIMAAEEFSMDEVDFGEMSISEAEGETAARSEASKENNLKKYGGNAASEAAVALALKWIVDHQLEDGGWNFNHTLGKGSFRNSPNPGDLIDARAGATAIALLPLFVIWFGIDEASKYALIAFGTFTPTVVATYGAVDNVDRSLIRMDARLRRSEVRSQVDLELLVLLFRTFLASTPELIADEKATAGASADARLARALDAVAETVGRSTSVLGRSQALMDVLFPESPVKP